MTRSFDPDPPRKWKRKLYDESKLDGLSRRERSELETDRDMDKEVEQLVCDVHEETHDPSRTDLANIAGAQKRMTSMLARVALSNQRVAHQMLCLTWAIGIMTFVMLIFVILTWWKTSGATQSDSAVKPSLQGMNASLEGMDQLRCSVNGCTLE
jgi:hypothetical protein